MNFKIPIVAYILSYERSRRSPARIKKAPGVQLQIRQIGIFAKSNGAEVAAVIYDQTTNGKTRFWLRPEFLKAMQFSEATSRRLVVGDLVELIRRLDDDVRMKALQLLRDRFPELTSATHFETVDCAIHIMADFAGAILKRDLRKKRKHTNSSTVISVSKKASGARGTRLKSNRLAELYAPVLSEILSAQPGAGSTYVAKALSEKGIKSPMGGQWHPSSTSNLLARCRKLGIIKT